LLLGVGNESIRSGVEVKVHSYKKARVKDRKRLEVFFTLTDNNDSFAFTQWQKNVPYRLKLNEDGGAYLTKDAGRV
jgi:hypothetical protein